MHQSTNHQPASALAPLAHIDRIDREAIRITDTPSAYKIRVEYSFINEFKELLNQYYNEASPSIPNIIHQVWIGPHAPPWKWIDTFRKKFKSMFPEWEYYLWREEDIARLSLYNRDLYEAETRYSGKVNILRYELLYRFGGIYIDADMEWLNEKPLDELLLQTNPTAIFAGMEDDRMYANSVIGASTAHPLLYYLIRLLRITFSETRHERKLPTWIASGPHFFSEALKPYGITAFPKDYFYPISWQQNHVGIDTSQFKNSYMIQYGYSTNQLQFSLES